MAQFKTSRDSRTDLTVIEVFGNVTHGEIPRFLETLRMDNPPSRAIFDFRNASLSELVKKRIKTDIHKVKQFTRPEIRAALVFSNPADFSIGKAITKAISKEGYLADIRGFYNFYLAKDWLLFQQLTACQSTRSATC